MPEYKIRVTYEIDVEVAADDEATALDYAAEEALEHIHEGEQASAFVLEVDGVEADNDAGDEALVRRLIELAGKRMDWAVSGSLDGEEAGAEVERAGELLTAAEAILEYLACVAPEETYDALNTAKARHWELWRTTKHEEE